jgi:uncharacterized OB-fold protein
MYRGVEVESRDLEEGRVLVVEHGVAPFYEWACGEALSFFLSKLKEAEIWGTKCRRCERILLPPRIFCEACFRRVDEWVKLRDTGVVKTFSFSYVNTDASRRREPQIVAVVAVDGASPGMGLLHLLGEVEMERVRVGLPVKAVWRPPASRRGAITDIEYFKPGG